jgi:diguanylate cyclase (GGDEF)-like protein
LINDRRGHAAGDAILCALSRVLASSVRSCDVVARWGGEEFVIAVPSTPRQGAVRLADRIREAVAEDDIFDSSQNRVQVTASFGVAQLEGGESLEHLVDRADRAMYAAKTAGRNRVFSMNDGSVVPFVPDPVVSPSLGHPSNGV